MCFSGAVYDGRDPLTTANMSRLMASLVDAGVPIKYLQLDPYWFTKGHGPQEWTPSPALYGSEGLEGLVNATHTPLLLYHCYWGSDSEDLYRARGQNFSFVPGYTFLLRKTQHKTLFQVDPDNAREFFEYIFGSYMSEGVMMGAEVDVSPVLLHLALRALLHSYHSAHARRFVARRSS